MPIFTPEEKKTVDIAPALIRELVSVYERYVTTLKEKEGLLFGQWVMKTIYPKKDIPLYSNLYEMVSTSRTCDSKLYLVSSLMAGDLEMDALIAFLAAQE